MKTIHVPVCVMGLAVFATVCAHDCPAQQIRAGGYAEASATNTEVVAAAAFAVRAEEKALREQKNAQPAKLQLVAIVSAQAQVVAGLNYRLKLKVKLNGAEKEAEAVVWWQAWRDPEPYKLTAWAWK